MIEQIKIQNFSRDLSLKISDALDFINTYFSDNDSVRIISIVLLILAIILFLLSVLVVSIRHIIMLIKNNNPAKNIKKDEAIGVDDIFSEDDEDELEKELQKELELARAEQQEKERQDEEKREKENQENLRKKELELAENKEKEEKRKEEDNIFKERKTYKEAKMELDWRKGGNQTNINQKEDVEALSLSYKQSSVELINLLGLAINMLGRGVDELKIAQTLNFKNQGMSDENEILKTIEALKEFINLSIKGKFARLEKYSELPSEEQALYHLANGDTTLALALLENLMDTEIDMANSSVSEEKRQRMYSEISSYACCFGTLAELNDIMLATSSYELAIELQSTNVVAWGRLGDVYKKASSMPKAIWAYQNVLNFADSEIDINQIANANKNISK